MGSLSEMSLIRDPIINFVPRNLLSLAFISQGYLPLPQSKYARKNTDWSNTASVTVPDTVRQYYAYTIWPPSTSLLDAWCLRGRWPGALVAGSSRQIPCLLNSRLQLSTYHKTRLFRVFSSSWSFSFYISAIPATYLCTNVRY